MDIKFSELKEGDEFIMNLRRWIKLSNILAIRVLNNWDYKTTTNSCIDNSIIMKPDALVRPVGRVKK